jgi:HSP20 family protein
VSKEDITLEILDNTIRIKGQRTSEKQEEDKKRGYHRVERSFGSFQRSVQIPGGFKADAVEAKFQNGVLRVTLPKREEAKPRTITVQSS